MIDVSQWRASIGLWNYCQAASSRPANGRHSQSFKAAVDSKSASSEQKTSKLPTALTLVAILILLFPSFSLLTHIFMIPSNGNISDYQHQSTMVTDDTNKFNSVILGSNIGTSDVIYKLVYLLLLLLLSGDIELNPGPMIDDKPSRRKFAKYLKPLVDWKSFALCLPGITRSFVQIINLNFCPKHTKMKLHIRWLEAYPQASWRDVINALKQCNENELAEAIEAKMSEPSERSSSSDDIELMEVMTSHCSIDTHEGNPKDILRSHYDKLVHAVSVNLWNISAALYAKGLILQQTKDEMLVLGVTDNKKANKLVHVIEQQLECCLTPEKTKQYFTDICHVLINQHHTLTDIATSMLHQLGQSIPDIVTSINSIPDVRKYADSMKQNYKHQDIVAATDWPPRIGKDFFGRLALVEKQDSWTQTKSAWHLLRGQVDETVKLAENKKISLEDVFQPTDNSLSLRVVIDGPPGIGKTTLCHKMLNMWSNGTLLHQQYKLVLYCPLRNSKIATATTLADLFEYRRYEVPGVADWFEKRNGEGLLIIFDGWDELSEQLRQSSLAAGIIHRKQLGDCSVIVTSRSYASTLLLKIPNLSRHVQVIGFSEKEISTVIIKAIQKNSELAEYLIEFELYIRTPKTDERDENSDDSDTDTSTDEDICDSHCNNGSISDNNFAIQELELLADKYSKLALKLIDDLKLRDDVRSLCYVPLVCSMVILVYRKEEGHLPTTLTQLYENFILQTIRRHAKKCNASIKPSTLASLSFLPVQFAKPFQEMCQLAYTNLANTRMAFVLDQLHEQSLNEANYLGLMSTFIEYDEEKYQFLHLSIQEFLAAWWIAKHEKTEEVFMNHFDNDHFRMCLRFVAGLTHLEHESYQQYFNKQQLELHCKDTLFGYQTHRLYGFCQNLNIAFGTPHNTTDDFDNAAILLFQLLYEAQNTELCQTLAISIKNQSLCLRSSLSSFDWLCLGYFLKNSKISWNHLHLQGIGDQSLSAFTAGLSSNNSLQTQCKILEVRLYNLSTHESLTKFLQLSLLNNVQECYCELVYHQYVPYIVFLSFLDFSQLKIVHLKMVKTTYDNEYYVSDTDIERFIAKNRVLQELKIEFFVETTIHLLHTIISVIRGVTKNKKLKSFLLKHSCREFPFDFHLPDDGVIEQLLKDNNTLQALSLDMPLCHIPSLNILEVNMPLTALNINCSGLMTSLLPHTNGLNCLILKEPYQLPYILFLSHPRLHTLFVRFNTAESAIELFAILQTNTTLKALGITLDLDEEEEERVTYSNVGTSLKNMLKLNKNLRCIDIGVLSSPSLFVSSLTDGIRHNSCLHELNVVICDLPNNENELLKNLLNSISQKNNLIQLQISISSYSGYTVKHHKKIVASWFYKQLVPAFTDMLQSHATIKILGITLTYDDFGDSFQPNWIKLVQNLYETIFTHPSLEYFSIPGYNILMDTFKNQRKMLIDRHRMEQPHKPLPVLKLGAFLL